MRFLAILPVVLSTVALLLALLCMFAGSKQGFMTDYAVLTVSLGRYIPTGYQVSLTPCKLSLIHQAFARIFRTPKMPIHPSPQSHS
jgi:hypothetical protein